jgi:hypothetical protein
LASYESVAQKLPLGFLGVVFGGLASDRALDIICWLVLARFARLSPMKHARTMYHVSRVFVHLWPMFGLGCFVAVGRSAVLVCISSLLLELAAVANM